MAVKQVINTAGQGNFFGDCQVVLRETREGRHRESNEKLSQNWHVQKVSPPHPSEKETLLISFEAGSRSGREW